MFQAPLGDYWVVLVALAVHRRDLSRLILAVVAENVLLGVLQLLALLLRGTWNVRTMNQWEKGLV